MIIDCSRFRSARTIGFQESVIRDMSRRAMRYGAVNLAQGFPDFSAPEVVGQGKLRLIVADVDAARVALRKSKIKFREETALILSLENKPGALKQVADSLTRARINVKCGYCTPSREGKRAIVVLTLSNTTKALGVLRTQSLDEF